MIGSNRLFSDNEYKIMAEIVDNENITQRELSKSLGVSVSTVNVLMNKMIKEGLIKMTQLSQKQVMYMLTPVGMMEKTQKTVSYIKIHYRAIYETEEKIKGIFYELTNTYDVIYVLKSNDEMGEVIGAVIDKLKNTDILIIPIDEKKALDISNGNSTVLIHTCSDEIRLREILNIKELPIINLIEKL